MKTESKQPGSSFAIPMVSEDLIRLKRVQSLLERLSVEVDCLVDVPEGDFQLLSSSEVHEGSQDEWKVKE